MSDDNGRKPVRPFSQAVSVPMIGQPLQLLRVRVKADADIRCACGGEVSVVDSVAVACPGCGKLINAGFNPLTAKLECMITTPEPEGVPS